MYDYDNNDHRESDFTKLVSSAKLDFQTEERFDLLLYLIYHYKSVEDTLGITRLVKCFEMIYKFRSYELPSHVSVLQGFLNCFRKAFTAKELENLKEHRKNIKKNNNKKKKNIKKNLECLAKLKHFNFFKGTVKQIKKTTDKIYHFWF